VTLPLKGRLTLWYVTLFALIVGAWSVFVVVIVRADLNAATDRALSLRASQVSQDFGDADEADFPDIVSAPLSGTPGVEAIAQLLSLDGSVLQSSGGAVASSPIAAADVVAKAVATGAAQTRVVVKGQGYRLLVARLPGRQLLILVGASTDATDRTVQRLMLIMLVTGPLVLIAAGLGGWLLARRALHPVAKMTATAAGIGIDRLDERVPVPSGSDELSALAGTLNTMLARLEEGVEAKRRLVADTSHELQTPLAVMRTEIDVSLASDALPPAAVEVLESAREETDRMTRIVRNLLTLARFDEGTLRLLRAPVDLRDVAEQSVASLRTLARERHVELSSIGEPAVAEGDAEYLRIVAGNLLENAIKYSGDGAHVTVLTRATDREAILTVADTGPGIPESEQAHIFDRFYRVDRSRSKQGGGSGLGLAIVREIVDAHGGRIELDSHPGSGSRFTVVLPAARTNVPSTKES
jgi:two-component system, OmpR family, sensor kinase